MELRELTYFVAVYEEQSITAAARRCFISQPSVSQALAALEHELDAKLFLRHRKGASPTPSADRLYPMARRLVDDADSLKNAFRGEVRVTRITVGLMRSLDVARTRELLALMTRERDLALRVVGADEPCDLRVVSKGLVAGPESFAHLWSERFVAALPAAHPLARRGELRSGDLAGEKFVERCHCEESQKFMHAKGKRQIEVAAVAQSEEWAIALVSAGVGLAVVPEGTAHDPRLVALRPLSDVHISREVGLAYRAKGAVSADVKRLVEKVGRRFGAASRGT